MKMENLPPVSLLVSSVFHMRAALCNNYPASEAVIKWNFRVGMPPLPWLKKH
jgi:hypothetical protein